MKNRMSNEIPGIRTCNSETAVDWLGEFRCSGLFAAARQVAADSSL